MTRAAAALLVVLTACAPAVRPPAETPRPGRTEAGLPETAERAYRALAPRFDREEAMEAVRFLQQYWRIAGNPGYNASIDYIDGRLPDRGMTVRVDEYANPTPGWAYTRGTVMLPGETEPVLSGERDRVSLAINSHGFSSKAVRLVDVGAVKGSATMAMPGMVMSGALRVEPNGTPGRYRGVGEFAMAGAWQFTLEWQGSGDVPAGKVAFEGAVQ